MAAVAVVVNQGEAAARAHVVQEPLHYYQSREVEALVVDRYRVPEPLVVVAVPWVSNSPRSTVAVVEALPVLVPRLGVRLLANTRFCLHQWNARRTSTGLRQSLT